MTEIPATVASNEFQLFGIYMKESASSCELILIYTLHSHPSLILCSLDLLDFKQRHMHKVDVSKATRHPSTLQLSSITDFFEQLKTRGAFSNLCKDVRHARNKNSQQQTTWFDYLLTLPSFSFSTFAVNSKALFSKKEEFLLRCHH